MSLSTRLVHIDALRGLAVLLMVLVHAAATWEPTFSGGFLLLGIVVSGAGGLAAPLFVTLLGWGLYQRSLTLGQRVHRAGWLFFFQFVINLSAPHLFEPWTPGVLSLMGLLVFIEPVWRPLFQTSKSARRSFATIVLLTFFLSVLLTPYQGPSAWESRIDTPNIVWFVKHLAMTGLYPLFPWIVFGFLGAFIASQDNENRHKALLSVFSIGLIVSLAVLAISTSRGEVWALPTGDAALTFFPANTPFLVAALTGVALLWWIVERTSIVHGLASLGRVSLTVYVAHFLPFAWFHTTDEMNAWSPLMTSMVVIGYTVFWIIAGSWLSKHAPNLTLEAWMRGKRSA